MNLIIFDFFGVMGGEMSPKWFKRHFDKEEALRLKEKYFVPADNGVYTIQETLHHIADDLGFDYDTVVSEFRENVSINYELFDYIKKLKKNNKVVLLSNAAIGIFDLFYPSVDLYHTFDHVFISAECHMQKPNPEFYLLAKNYYDMKFDRVYMIDDKQKNLDNLDKIGIQSILYTGNEDLFQITDKLL